MARWQQWPVIDGAYADDARPWSCQDTVNWLTAPAEQAGTRSSIMLRTPPGLVAFSDLGTNAPLRGSHDVEGLLLVVSDTTLYRVSTAGVATAIGTIPGVGRVSMDHTPRGAGFHVGIANGQSGYIYDTATDALTQITDPGFPGATIFQFIDGYLAFLEPFGKFWGHSELNDGLSYNTLDRYTAESAPDGIVSLIVSHREVFVLGTRSGEFFRNTGQATGTFQRADGYEMERGICSPYAIARSDNTVKWVGDDGATYRLEGHQPVRVSNGPVEQAFAASNLANAFAFAWDDRSHNVFYVTLPDGQTWGHDAWTQRWHRRQSYGLNRWRLATLTKWNGQWIGGDYTNGKLYTLSWADDAVHEDGEPLVSERTFPIAHDFCNDLIINGIRLLFDTGKVGPTPEGIVVSGDLPDGHRGDALTGFEYTATGGTGTLVFTVASGTFPPGLTLNPDGSVSGTYTEGGVFSWVIAVTDQAGQVEYHPDGAAVSQTDWWLANLISYSGQGNVYIEDAPVTFANDPIARSPASSNVGSYFGPIQSDTSGLVAFFGDTQVERITDPDPAGGITVASLVSYGMANLQNVRCIGGVWFLFNGTSSYKYSTDDLLTFQTYTDPSGRQFDDIARLDSGRWVSACDSGPTQVFVYSDQAVPTIWTFAQNMGAGSFLTGGKYFACNGDAAVLHSNIGNFWRTTDGLSYAQINVPALSGQMADIRDALANDDVMMFVGQQAVDGACVIRSADAGLTWARINLPSMLSLSTFLRYADGYWMVTGPSSDESANAAFYSTDDGATYNGIGIPLPFLDTQFWLATPVTWTPSA